MRTVTPGPEALRAISHPTRMRMLGMLRADGPATATTLAQRMGLNTGATSYHLRQLAGHGFIEDDPSLGNARERWWRASHNATDSTRGETEEAQMSQDAFLEAMAITHSESLRRALGQLRGLPLDWQEASTFGDVLLRLTPDALARLKARLWEVLTTEAEALEDECVGDPATEPVVVQVAGYLWPDSAFAQRDNHQGAGDG